MPDGDIVVDPRGKVPGRGAYLCPRPSCFSSGRARAAVSRALQVDVSDEDWHRLVEQLEQLAAERGPLLEQELS